MQADNVPSEKRLRELEQLVIEKDSTIRSLEELSRRLENRIKELESRTTPLIELDETMKKLIARISMILQAEKCIFLLYDPDKDALVASKPAIGFTDDEIALYRVNAADGISGESFSGNMPIVVSDAVHDFRAVKEKMLLYNISNGVCVPLVVEKHDDDEDEVEQQPIGVLHVFNKRYGGVFSDEDVKMLTRLAQNAAAVIASAQMYREVVQEREELGHVIESVYSGIIMVTSGGKVVQMNASFRQMLGIGDSDRIYGDFNEVIPSDIVNEFIGKALNGPAEIEEEIVLPDPKTDEEGTERIFHAQSAIAHTDEQESGGIVAIFNDITEFRSVERLKTAFVSTVSHELRTPLTSIKGFISTLLRDSTGFDAKTVREFYIIIDQECDRLMRLINDLLNLSRIEAGRALDVYPVAVSVQEIVDKVVAVQAQNARKHEFTIHLDPSIPVIMADKDKVEQILMNLVNNAVKYSPNGGGIEITAKRAGDNIRISVADHGIGIPREHLGNVFKRFFRVDSRDTRKAGGTGIGLYLVRNLVEAHGGKVWAESEPGKGSTFTFELPECPTPSEAERDIVPYCDLTLPDPEQMPMD